MSKASGPGARVAAICSLLDHYGTLPGFFTVRRSAGATHKAGWLVFLEPVQEFIWDKDDHVYLNGSHLPTSADPFTVLDNFLSETISVAGEVPCVVGFFSYELASQIEDIPAPKKSLYNCPLVYLISCQTIIELEDDSDEVHIFHSGLKGTPFWQFSPSSFQPVNEEIQESLESRIFNTGNLLPHLSHTSHGEYLKSVAAIRKAILEGDVYQVNYTQTFSLTSPPSPPSYMKALLSCHSAPYSAYGVVKDTNKNFEFTIASASPELFLKREGSTLKCSPIKGTAPRGNTDALDELNKRTLSGSDKDNAELAMIVDLIRNDMGRIAPAGSVRVSEHARLETHPNVHHLVSDVVCRLPEKWQVSDCLKALFPCGSITGAPKISAMNYIAGLEPHQRGVYTGSIGYFGRNEFELNVAIRTAVITDRQLLIQAGGGIVIDSESEAEYQESIIKAATLMAAASRVSDTLKFPVHG